MVVSEGGTEYKRAGMRIIVTGLVGQYAFGGVAWDYLQYVEGFRRLGHEVFYLEDSETWPYDPVGETFRADCGYNVAFLGGVMERLGLGGRWIYRNGPDAAYHGVGETEVRKICADARLFVNVSGCCWLRPEYTAIPKKVFLDTDPMFTQVGLLTGIPEHRARVRAHDVHFTFAENIGQPDCRIPAAGFHWLPTRQPVVLDWWVPSDDAPRDAFTTVMNWVSYQETEFDGERWGQKDVEFLKFADLPRRAGQPLEVVMGVGPGRKRPTELLREKGWRIVEPDDQLPDPWSYREYLRRSKGEWSVAKEAYVKSRSGWFSCRSACYLALGRPCVLQDTGWSKHHPTGEGLLAFSTMEEAVAGLENVAANYPAHCRAARKIAATRFDARTVLAEMIERAGV